MDAPTLLDVLTGLRDDVARAAFPIALDGVDAALACRRRLLDQLDHHLLPRLQRLVAPAVVVVGGSTGSGKSTVVNSLLGSEVSAAGILRPTTRRPVLAHHPDDAAGVVDHPLLPIVDVVVHEAVPRGIVLVDAPDLDSLLESNRSASHRLLEAADLWLFLTTPARYGDALPWDVLGAAMQRGASVAMLLNRVADDALVTVRGELMTRMRERGMSGVPLFVVPDVGPHQGMLEPSLVAPVRHWLAMVAGPDRGRSVVARTQRGAVAALGPWVEELAGAVLAQVDADVVGRASRQSVLDRAAVPGAPLAKGGALVRGPVRARWAAATAGGVLSGRSTRRRAAQRAAALEQLRPELEAAVALALGTVERSTTSAVAAALDPDAVPAWTPASPLHATAAAGWVRGVESLVDDEVASTDVERSEAGRRLVTAVGAQGAGLLVALAAAGLGPAKAQLTKWLGPDRAEEIVAVAGAQLADLQHEHARSAAERPTGHVGPARPADVVPRDLPARLHDRLAALRAAA